MRCDDVQKLLGFFTADALRAGLRARIQDHLETCPSCQREHEAFLKTMALLETLPQAEPDRDLWAGVLAAITRPAHVPGLRPVLVRAAVAVGLAGAIAFAAGRYARPPEPTVAMATSAGPMAQFIQEHVRVATHDPLTVPPDAALLEAVNDR